jgi:hypothetical protein
MSERIRYGKPNDTGSQTSKQVFTHPSNGAQYAVALNGDTWTVLDPNTHQTVLTGTNPRKHKAQLEVRAALVSLGIELNTEKRKERTKPTPVTA